MAVLNQPAPMLDIEQWVQGPPSNIDKERGRVILIEVFQVNCPGCFTSGLPEAIDIFLKHKDKPLTVWGLATAFEDYRLNSLENLQKLIETGEPIGETFRYLSENDMLSMDRLQYFIPFPVAWDRITIREGDVLTQEIEAFIDRDFPEFEKMPPEGQAFVRKQITAYLEQKEYNASTFDTYQLKGTPSSILIDKNGILRETLFGSGQALEERVLKLLDE